MLTRSKSDGLRLVRVSDVAVRQLCLSADMIPADYLETLRNIEVSPAGPSVSISSLQPEQKEKLIEKLRQAIADQEECSVRSPQDIL